MMDNFIKDIDRQYEKTKNKNLLVYRNVITSASSGDFDKAYKIAETLPENVSMDVKGLLRNTKRFISRVTGKKFGKKFDLNVTIPKYNVENEPRTLILGSLGLSFKKKRKDLFSKTYNYSNVRLKNNRNCSSLNCITLKLRYPSYERKLVGVDTYTYETFYVQLHPTDLNQFSEILVTLRKYDTSKKNIFGHLYPWSHENEVMWLNAFKKNPYIISFRQEDGKISIYEDVKDVDITFFKNRGGLNNWKVSFKVKFPNKISYQEFSRHDGYGPFSRSKIEQWMKIIFPMINKEKQRRILEEFNKMERKFRSRNIT